MLAIVLFCITFVFALIFVYIYIHQDLVVLEPNSTIKATSSTSREKTESVPRDLSVISVPLSSSLAPQKTPKQVLKQGKILHVCLLYEDVLHKLLIKAMIIDPPHCCALNSILSLHSDHTEVLRQAHPVETPYYLLDQNCLEDSPMSLPHPSLGRLAV